LVSLFISGAQPVLARVLDSGEVAYIPPWWKVVVPQTSPLTLAINFGNVQNPGEIHF
jgi:hypothetical protein